MFVVEMVCGFLVELHIGYTTDDGKVVARSRSGGGSVNVFAKDKCILTSENFDVSGKDSKLSWLKSGDGTFSFGTIGTGTYISGK